MDKEDKSMLTNARDAPVSPLAKLGLALQARRERRFFPSRFARAVGGQINAELKECDCGQCAEDADPGVEEDVRGCSPGRT